MKYRLAELGSGKRGIIQNLSADNGKPQPPKRCGCCGTPCGFKRTAEVLGLHPGREVLVVENRGKGPLLVEVEGRTFVLGRGQAEKIWVKPKEEAENETLRG